MSYAFWSKFLHLRSKLAKPIFRLRFDLFGRCLFFDPFFLLPCMGFVRRCFPFCWVEFWCPEALAHFLMYGGSASMSFRGANLQTVIFIHFKHCLHLLHVSCSCILGDFQDGQVVSICSSSSFLSAVVISSVYCLYSSPGTSSWVRLYIWFIVWSAIMPLTL